MDDLGHHGELSANMVGFGRLLRKHGVKVGPGEEHDALRALNLIDLSLAESFRHSIRTTLAKSKTEQEVFDQYFDSYWNVWDRAMEMNRPGPEEESRDTPGREKSRKHSTPGLQHWLSGNSDTSGEQEAAGYSPLLVKTRRDFHAFEKDELQEVVRIIRALGKRLASRLSRRRVPSSKPRTIDLRRTLRLGMRHGGEWMELAHKKRRTQKLNLVLLCDVSRSMDLYNQFLLLFLLAFQRAFHRMETFVFSTSLYRVTETLQSNNIEEVLTRLSEEIPVWSGGTRIGASLDSFVETYGPAVLDRNTVVMIMSDGWDTGEVDRLESALKKIRKRSRSIIWLNPLMGSPDYQPETRGMKAALPYLDILAPVHNIESLRRLGRELINLQR